jgi:hypothetical protein
MGFTPDQITALTSSGVPTIPPDQGDAALTSAPAGDTSPLSSPVPEETPAPAVENPPVNNPVETVDNSEKILTAISDMKEDLKKSIQAQNIKTQSFNAVSPDNALENALASIIRPNYDKGEVK